MSAAGGNREEVTADQAYSHAIAPAMQCRQPLASAASDIARQGGEVVGRGCRDELRTYYCATWLELGVATKVEAIWTWWTGLNRR
jgi:hypothetical protein